MRRSAPTLPVSPQQLKHFAAATVAITVLLALFAGGDADGLGAELEAREARNQLIEAETTKLGTKQLKANLKLKDGRKSQATFSDSGDGADPSAEWGAGGGGSGRVFRPATSSPSPSAAAHPKLPRVPGESVTIAGADGVPDGAKPESSRAKKAPPKAAQKMPEIEPTQEQLDNAMEASRQRSGQSDLNGDD